MSAKGLSQLHFMHFERDGPADKFLISPINSVSKDSLLRRFYLNLKELINTEASLLTLK